MNKLSTYKPALAMYAMIVIANYFLHVNGNMGGFMHVLQDGMPQFQRLFEDEYLLRGLKCLGEAVCITPILVVAKHIAAFVKEYLKR